jgi:hypothetical protein
MMDELIIILKYSLVLEVKAFLSEPISYSYVRLLVGSHQLSCDART